MILATILFCLTVITTYLTAGLYARYITRNSAGDSARVIKFDKISITDTFEDENRKLIITPGVPCKREVKVSFDGSEAVTYIFLEVDVSSQWWFNGDANSFSSGTDLLKFSINTSNWKYLGNKSNKYIYYYVDESMTSGIIAPNTVIKDIQVITEGKIAVSKNVTMDMFPSFKDLSVKFSATAVQANGFENVEAAWASIEAKNLD